MENGQTDLKVSKLVQVAAFLDTDFRSLVIDPNEDVSVKADEAGKDRLIGILITRLEYVTDQIECMRQQESR